MDSDAEAAPEVCSAEILDESWPLVSLPLQSQSLLLSEKGTSSSCKLGLFQFGRSG